MIKTVTSGEWLAYRPAQALAATDELVARLADRLLVLSTHRSPFDERKVARAFGYSQPHFRRLCHHAIGESAHSFVLRTRLERSAMLLAAGLSVASTASESAFESREGFSKAFASHFGCAPSEFQRLNQNAPLEFPCQGHAVRRSRCSVKIRTEDDSFTTFLYDGAILLGRAFSDGRIDWRSNFRRDCGKS